MNIIEKKPVSITVVKEIMEKKSEEVAELGYEQQQALEHAQKFAGDSKKINKIVEALKEKLGEELAIKIADINPKTPESVKTIALKFKKELTDEEAKEILDVLG